MSSVSKPLTLQERTQQRFAEFAKGLFNEVAEIDQLMLVVDWSFGKTTLQPGFLIRRDSSIGPGDILDALTQLTKMSQSVLKLYLDMMDNIVNVQDQLQAEISESKEKLERVKKEIAQLEQNNRVATKGTSDGACNPI